MNKIVFNIPIYDFDVTILEVQQKEDSIEVCDMLRTISEDESSISQVAEYIVNEDMNGGDTFRNMPMKQFIVVIYPCRDEQIRREIINHEKRHIEDRIIQYCGIDDIEASAYLAGYISKFMY